MNNTPEETNAEAADDRINNVVALNQLVGTIVDYYSFKHKLVEDEDEVDKWKKGEENTIVPAKIDTIIEKSFIAQLKKFTVE